MKISGILRPVLVAFIATAAAACGTNFIDEPSVPDPGEEDVDLYEGLDADTISSRRHISYTLCEDAVEVSAATAEKLVATTPLMPDASTLVFNGVSAAELPAPGQYIVVPVSSKAPLGITGEVTAVRTEGSRTVLETTQCNPEVLYKTLDVDMAMNPQDLATQPGVIITFDPDGFFIETEDNISRGPASRSTSSIGFKYPNGDVEIAPVDSGLSLKISTPETKLGEHLSVTTSGEIKVKFKTLQTRLTKSPDGTFNGTLNYVVQPKLAVAFNVEGKIEGGCTKYFHTPEVYYPVVPGIFIGGYGLTGFKPYGQFEASIGASTDGVIVASAQIENSKLREPALKARYKDSVPVTVDTQAKVTGGVQGSAGLGLFIGLGAKDFGAGVEAAIRATVEASLDLADPDILKKDENVKFEIDVAGALFPRLPIALTEQFLKNGADDDEAPYSIRFKSGTLYSNDLFPILPNFREVTPNRKNHAAQASYSWSCYTPYLMKTVDAEYGVDILNAYDAVIARPQTQTLWREILRTRHIVNVDGLAGNEEYYARPWVKIGPWTYYGNKTLLGTTVSKIAAIGEYMAFGYYDDGRLKRIVNTLSETVTNYYPDENKIVVNPMNGPASDRLTYTDLKFDSATGVLTQATVISEDEDGPETTDVRFTYTTGRDGQVRVKTMTADEAWCIFEYDNSDNLVSVTSTDGDGRNPATTTYTYSRSSKTNTHLQWPMAYATDMSVLTHAGLLGAASAKLPDKMTTMENDAPETKVSYNFSYDMKDGYINIETMSAQGQQATMQYIYVDVAADGKPKP